MASAFRLAWALFTLAALTTAVAFLAWPADSAISRDVLGVVPAVLLFVLAVTSATVRANPEMRATQFRNVVLLGSIGGLFVGQLLIVANAFGAEIEMVKPVVTMMGAILIVAGNYLPKCTREDALGVRAPWTYFFSIPWQLPLSFLFGVRTWWTLASDHVWNRTHRFASRLWILGGVAYVVLPWAIEMPDLAKAILAAWTLMTIVPIVYSFGVWWTDRQAVAT